MLPSESTFSRAFDEFARSELATRVHEQMIKVNLGESLIGHISRDATSIEARERVAKPEALEPTAPTEHSAPQSGEPTAVGSTPECAKPKRGRPRKDEQRALAPKAPSVLERQRTQNMSEMLAELPQARSVGTKLNAKGYKSSWRGYKLHLDTAC